MYLHYLKLFHVAATDKNFTQAAASLYMSQPSLSMQLKKLEKELGVKLFDRVGNRSVLNENGKLLLGYTQQIFALVDEASIAIMHSRDVVTGNLTIGGSNTGGVYLLPKMIGILKKRYPMVNVNLHVADTCEITRLILENKIDFALNGGNIEYPPTIHCEKLLEEPLIFAAAPNSPLAKKVYIKPDDLKDYTFISHEKQSQLYQLTEKIIENHKLPSSITMTFNNIDAIKQAVEADLGVSLFPYTAVRNELDLGLLREIHLENHSWTYTQSLIYNINRRQSPASLKMMEIVRSSL